MIPKFFTRIALIASSGILSTALAQREAIEFNSSKVWVAARWYLIGRWTPPNQIQWTGGGVSQLSLPMGCPQQIQPSVKRTTDNSSSTKLESLVSGSWIALEVDPTVVRERIQLQLGTAANCVTSAVVDMSWSGERGKLQPQLVLSPRDSIFYGQRVRFKTPPEVDLSSDLLLEVLLGFWKLDLPNAASGGSKSLYSAPVAIARGEWTPPFSRNVGLQIGLEQSLSSLGETSTESVLFSDWYFGPFVQHMLPVADALVLRGAVRFYQHLSDDNFDQKSIGDANRDAQYLTVSSTIALFYLKRWMTAVHLEYGPPTSMAGRGEKQSLLNGSLRFGYRFSPGVTGLLETGYRKYGLSESSSESVLNLVQTGFRIEF